MGLVSPITGHVGDVIEVDMGCFVTKGDELVKRCVLGVDPYRLRDGVGFSIGPGECGRSRVTL